MRLDPIYQEFTGGSSEHTALELPGRRSEVEPVVPLPYVALPWMEGQGVRLRAPAFLLRRGPARQPRRSRYCASRRFSAQYRGRTVDSCTASPLFIPSAYVQETRPGRPPGHEPPGHLFLESEAHGAGLP
jgi:hypothetical protein